MPEFREDKFIYPQLIRLAACLEQEIINSGLPPVSFVGVIVGDLDAVEVGDDEDCGGAWVRLSQGYPTTAFPAQDGSETCASRLAFQVTVGIMRCFSPFSDERGNAQGVEAQLKGVRLQLADMAAMFRAIKCCFVDSETEYVLGNYTPTNALGGTMGGTWTVTIGQE